ncbi:MAG: HlyD family efflux transporter periplasmic adaptor subunit, partial [Bacillota bacterium]|nr:HlyD family efflux transporter periplasmic adaptor subunit [Bacillota bacterium]
IERSELAVQQTSDNIAKQTVKAKTSGTVTKMYVSKGATIAVGTPVCDIVNDEQMILRVPFLVENAQNIFVGESATVPLVGTYYTLSGSVSKVTNGHLVSSMGNEVSMIEIIVQNPGTLKKDDKATAVIGDYACSDVGTFDYASTETVTSEGAGKILNLPISVGDHVTSQTALANLDTSTLVTANEQNALAIKDAKLSLQSLKDKVKDYNISAPITGTILTKNVKAGDTVSQANMSALAVMADLKNLCFKITVDDTDIAKVKLGQSVKFKTDAMPDKEHFGTVSFIPDAGTKTGDATLYEVRVSVKPEDDLKNGMNVSAEILLN